MVRMNKTDHSRALTSAVEAARAVGKLMRENQWSRKKVNSEVQYDIKLELDVRSQELIQKKLKKAFPEVDFLGEEGEFNPSDKPYRWVVDPIDGTVNFAYGIPHACTCIALQRRLPLQKEKGPRKPGTDEVEEYETVVGVIYDPFCDELWTAIRGQKAKLNDRHIQVSRRKKLNEAIVAIGFAKLEDTINRMMPLFQALVPRVRKVRMMGSAGLAMAYVATGRMDAYREFGVRIWDIAAGGLIVECAGGEFWRRAVPGRHAKEIIANNGLLRPALQRLENSLRQKQRNPAKDV